MQVLGDLPLRYTQKPGDIKRGYGPKFEELDDLLPYGLFPLNDTHD